MVSHSVLHPLKRVAMRGATLSVRFFAEVAALLATVLALTAVNPAYAWESATEASDSSGTSDPLLRDEIDDLVRAIDSGGIQTADPSPSIGESLRDNLTDGLKLWVSSEVQDRVNQLGTKSRWSSAVKKLIQTKIEKQLGARQSAAWSAWAHW